jgi:Fur family transcriptional regulator, peroxide stress response regulator
MLKYLPLRITSNLMNQGKVQLTPMDEFKQVLKSHSLKATSQRLMVHKAMLELGHASADMVCERIGHEPGGGVSVASVYNILTQMAELGVYQHRMSSNNKMYFDVNTFRHIHLYDAVNNEYRDVIDDELLALVENHLKDRRFRGYKVDSVDIQIVCHPSRKTVKKS